MMFPKIWQMPLLAGIAVMLCSAAFFADAADMLQVEQPWARATAKNAANGIVYLTIIGTNQTDRFISASSPVAASVDLHTDIEDNGIMRMRSVNDMRIAAGSRVVLEPGGMHFMLSGLKEPLKEGQHFPLALVFEKAGKIEVDVRILAAGALKPY